MKIRPMNRTLVILPEGMSASVDNPEVARIIEEGKILLPEHNTIMKISDHAKVVRAAKDCHYPYLKNQRICWKQFNGVDYVEDGVKYKLIKEWDINFVYES